MSEKYTIGLDFGTLSGRALLVRISDGAELAARTMEYPHGVMDRYLCASGEELPPDFALQDPHDYLEVLDYILPGVIADAKVDKENIIGIGVDFTTCTMLPIKADGTPLCFEEKYRKEPHAYAKLWKHHAAQPYADRINEVAKERGEEWLAAYGGKISSEWYFPKVFEVLDKAPEVYADADHFVEAGDFINMYLCGCLKKSYTYAASKAMYDMEKGYPSREFFAALDPRFADVVKDKTSAPMVYTCEKVGNVRKEIAERYGLSEKTVVATAQPDAHVATSALNMHTAGDMCAIMGTSACYMLIDDKRRNVKGICGVLRDSLTPGFWGYESGLCCLGDAFAWAAENIAPASYREEADSLGISVLRLLINKCAEKAPGETGLVALDWLNGNRNVLIDSDLSAMILGMDLRTRPEDIMRALIEATAFATRVITETIEASGVEIRRIIAAGGISRKDPFTMQLYADVLKKDILIAESRQIPALASAVYAAASAGEDLLLCMERMCHLSDTVYHPNTAASEVYDALYKEYLTLYDYFGRGQNDVMKRLRRIKENSKK